MNRRNFIRTNSIVGLGTLFLPTSVFSTTLFSEKVRVGLIATGFRGQIHLNELLRRDDVEVTAIADPNPQMVKMALKLFEKHNKRIPKVFDNGDSDYKNLLKLEDVDAVIISTPGQWHFTQAIETMRAGKIVGLEVSGAMNMDECWEYVNVSEETNIPIFMMENVCYRRDIMSVFNMARKGKFGEIVHGQGSHQHDFRNISYNNGAHVLAQGAKDTNLNGNGELSPTHAVGPLATMMNVNRGNRITHLTSMASKQVGLSQFNNGKVGENLLNPTLKSKQGDIVRTILHCENGQTILLTDDPSLQRAYNLGLRIQGTDGNWQDFKTASFDPGFSSFDDEIENSSQTAVADGYMGKYEHPLWKKYKSRIERTDNNGMDSLLIRDFIECIKENKEFPFDVYDLATWYSITSLSEKSIAGNGSTQEMPDFTKGKYRNRKPVFGIG